MSAGIAKAIRAIGRGEVVIVTDDEDRENEGDLIMAAERVTTEALAFFLEHTSGVDLRPAPRRAARRARPAADGQRQPRGPAHGVHGDRRSRPRHHDGHLGRRPRAHAPGARRPARRRRRLRPARATSSRCAAAAGGVLERAGHTEAAVDLARLAGLPAGGRPVRGRHRGPPAMARRPELEALARAHGLPMIIVADAQSATACAPSGSSTRSPRRPCPRGTATFTCQAWRSVSTASTTSRSSRATSRADEPLLVRVHSECLTGDVFGSRRCDCGSQLADAHDAIARGGPRRPRLPARPRGPRHRDRVQAAGLRAAGRRPRHRRRQRAPRPPGRLPRVRHRRPDPASTLGVERCG